MRVVNDALLNMADYERFGAVKKLLAMYTNHQYRAKKGDQVAHSILIDLRAAMYSGALNGKQLETAQLYFIHKESQDEIAAKEGVSQQAVSRRVNKVVRSIQDALLSGNLFN